MSRKMKDSGVEWIGEIPEEWSIVKVKSLFELGRGRVIAQTELKEDGLYPVYSSQTKNNGCLGYIDTYDFDKNQLTWTTDGANAGTVFLREGKYNCTNVCGTLLPRTNDNLKFLKYDLEYIAIYHKRLDTNGYKIMNNEMAEIRIVRPELSEQNKIANYLDSKCTKIDQTIEKEKEVIEKLKEYKQSIITEAVTNGLNPDAPMKDSGVEWIGEIPEKWKIVKLKQVFSFRKGLSITKDNLVEKGVKVISYGQIHSKNNNGVSIDDSLIRYVGNEYLEIGKQSLVSQNDFIFADTSEDLNGAGNCVFVDLDEEIFAGYHTIILAPIKRDIISNWRYFAYLYKTDCWRSQIRSRVSGIKLFSITQKILKQVDVIMPDIKEQQEIIDYLDKKCSAIDKLITNKEKVIEKLTEYKKSLIYECVTGKREVQ